jgi:hypothetical protein
MKTPPMVIHTMAPKIESMITGVAEAQQLAKGGAITLIYTDGTAERGASKGKRLGRLAPDGSVDLGDFDSLFAVVSHIQEQRPKTKIFTL